MIEFAYEMLVVEFAYEMLAVALRAVGVFAFWGGLICLFWGSLICLFWGVATLCRVVVQLVKRYM